MVNKVQSVNELNADFGLVHNYRNISLTTTAAKTVWCNDTPSHSAAAWEKCFKGTRIGSQRITQTTDQKLIVRDKL